jgi:hypothetical protein
MKESGGQLRGDKTQAQTVSDYGYIRVTELTDDQGNDLLAQWQVDTDVAYLQLNQALLPGASITLNFSFISQLPKVFARSGHDGKTFNFVAQWFPKPAVFYNGRWIDHHYHAHSEFFADFGEYQVTLAVPKDYVVGATGVLVSQQAITDEEGREQVEYRFVAEDVHDFVWTADKNFLEAVDEWHGINIRLLYQKGLDPESVSYQLDVAKATFSWFDEYVGPYPFRSMTLVQPPEEGAGAGGMEYPMLVTTTANIKKSRFNEMAAIVTIHEIGHNYWQGMLASNEFEESWLDEGINSYTEGRIIKEAVGKTSVARLGPFQLDMESLHRLSTSRYRELDTVLTPSWGYIGGRAYGVNSYDKPATILNTAQRVWGRDKIDRLLKHYYQQWSFKHPTTSDFIEVAKSVDLAMGNFIEQAVTTTDTIDLQVYQLTSTKKRLNGGFDLTSDELPPPFNEPKESELFFNRVVLAREGQLKLPKVNVRLAYDDGTVEMREWVIPYDTQWTRWEWQSKAKLKAVFIDPEQRVLLDKKLTNNLKQTPSTSHWRWILSYVQELQMLTSTLLPL